MCHEWGRGDGEEKEKQEGGGKAMISMALW